MEHESQKRKLNLLVSEEQFGILSDWITELKKDYVDDEKDFKEFNTSEDVDANYE